MISDKKLLCTKSYIGGEWMDADNGAKFEVLNPATMKLIGIVPNMGANEASVAINKAELAWLDWREQTAKYRAQILRNWYSLIIENTEDLAQIITAECGKPLAESRSEVAHGAAFVEWFAEEGKRIYGDVVPSVASDKRIIVIKQAIGVVAIITPWNFPLAMITRKCAAAFAAGCSVVAKPAAQTPLTALALAELAHRAGIPAGLFNVVTSSKAAEVGAEFCANPIVRKLSFTGSTNIGKVLIRQSADTVKKLSLELGGNAPFVVFDDADIDAAVTGALLSKYRNAGQTCVCANRFLVQAEIYDEFAKKLTVAASKLTIGNGVDAGVNQGPLINQAAVEKIIRHITDAVSKGAKVECGGKQPSMGGNFFEPTVLTEVTSDMLVAKEETFGPLAPLFKFETEAEAIAMANDTEFGLAAYFYARDIGRVWRVAEALEYGMVGINEGIISTEVAPFGGVKESGLGREGSHYGIDDYVELKYLCLGGL